MPRFIAFACDYDETLARDGRVPAEGVSALQKMASAGRKHLLVTGRELPDVAAVFPEISLFDRVIAENGALLYRPQTGETKLLAPKAPERFVSALGARGVSPLSVGEVIVATREPNEEVVLETIRDLGLKLQVIFNKGAVMVLPTGINKGNGLIHALRELGLSRHNCVAIGDAENDLALLGISGCAAAVANAVPMLKERADIVTIGEATAGVVELAQELLADDLRRFAGRLSRHHLLVGEDARGRPFRLRRYDGVVLICGQAPPATSALIRDMTERKYQYCLVDPEGTYRAPVGAVRIGSDGRAPPLDEVLQILSNPAASCVLNLSRLPPEERPACFAALLDRLEELRARTGRPAWTIASQAQSLMRRDGGAPRPSSAKLESMLLITDEPAQLPTAVLQSVDEAIAAGDDAAGMLESFGRAAGASLPPLEVVPDKGEVLLWRIGDDVFRLRLVDRPDAKG